MKRQRNTTQMKEQTRNTEIQINEEEIGKLSEKKIQNNDSKDEVIHNVGINIFYKVSSNRNTYWKIHYNHCKL